MARKIMLLFCCLLSLFTANAGQRFKVISAMTDQPLEAVEIWINKGCVGKTDVNGKFRYSKDLQKGDQVQFKHAHYIARTQEYYRYGTFISEGQIYLYPDAAYEDRVWKEEDERYGVVEKPDPDSPVEKSTENTVVNYKNGFADLVKYITREVNYPQECIEKKQYGKVFIRFAIEPDGNVSHIYAIPNLENAALLEYEAKRIVRKMQGWKPEIEDGKPVRSFFILPINFIPE